MSARFVWSDATGLGRNRFVLFRRVVHCQTEPRSGILHLFVDNRYRLRVNGVIAGYGPIRFLPNHPEFDSIDLSPYLRRGENVIVVEAYSPCATNFQAMRESRGGFMAWGSIAHETTDDLSTPGAWQQRRAPAWDEFAGAFSFAQGPVEILDLAKLPESLFVASQGEGWSEPTLIADPIWGTPTTRSIPLLGLASDAPASLMLAATLATTEERLVGRVVAIEQMAAKGANKIRFPSALCIHSPRAQEVTIGTFWGPNYLNGADLVVAADPLLGNRQNATAPLRAGWNLMYGEPEVLADIWGVLVDVPRAAGLTLRSEPSMEAPHGIRVGPAMTETRLAAERGAVPATAQDLARLPWTWTVMDHADMPAREVAWDRIGTVISRNQPLAALSLSAGSHVLLYDFGTEVLGHVQLDIEAPAGTIVDSSIDERHRADGQLALFGTNPFADTVDRFRTAGGLARLEGFHPRGGRYLQLTIRLPDGASGCTVHHVAIRDARVAVPSDGSFRCSDPVLTWAWSAGLATLRACVEDAFLDCPWRERGTYLGDSLVEANALRAVSRDLSVAWRTATLAAQSQTPDGQVMGCVPSWMTGPGGDFTLIWVLMLRDLWAASGDLARLRALWPTVEGIVHGSRWKADAHGLWTAIGVNMFIDWGITTNEARSGEANAVLNALRIRALQCAAELATALGLPSAAGFSQEAQSVTAAYRSTLWLATEQRFAGFVANGQPTTTVTAIHANVLVLAFGIATPEQNVGVVRFVTGELPDNAQRAIGTHPEYLEIYYLHYTLQALYRQNLAALAEQVMRSHYQILQHAGAWTLWEGMRGGYQQQGSLCHAWSAAAMWACTDHVLGVRFERPGHPDSLVIAPDSHLTWASGTVPHPKGVVRISWRREANVLWLEAELPAGVTAQVHPAGGLKSCRVFATVRTSPAKAAHG